MQLIPSVVFLTVVFNAGLGFQRFPESLVKKSLTDVSQVTLENCGISKVRAKGDRIVGGRDALPGEFPWAGSLRYSFFFSSPQHICGCTILNKYWAVTAAHCVHKRHESFWDKFEVGVGMHSLDSKTPYTTIHKVDNVIEHENFSMENFQNDIALLHLKKPIEFSKTNGYVNGICLPPNTEDCSGDVQVAGWGTTEEDGDVSNVMQVVNVPMVNRSSCKDAYGGDLSITNDMYCAGLAEGGKDSCQGDSGGPFMVTHGTGAKARSSLDGIVSFGMGCARPRYPGVYTKVSSFIPWILFRAY